MKYNMPFTLYIDAQDFFDYTGIDLERDGRLKVDDTGTKEGTINNFLMESAEMVYTYITTRTKDAVAIDILLNDEEYKEAIYVAQLYQAKYMYENGNSLAINGLTSGTPTELKDLRGLRAYSPAMINFLDSKGFFYGGIC